MIKKVDQKILSDVRDQTKIAIHAVLQEILQSPLHVIVRESEVTHDLLQPEGQIFNIRLRVEVHPKKEQTP